MTEELNIDKPVHQAGLKLLKDIPDNSIDLILTDPPYVTSRASGMDKWVTHVAACNQSTTNFKTESEWRNLKTKKEWEAWLKRGKFAVGKESFDALRNAKKNYLKYGSVYGDKYAVTTDYGEWDSAFTMKELRKTVKEYYRVLKPGGTCILFFDLWKITNVKEIFEKHKFKQLRLIEWLKTNPPPINGRRNYLSNAREVAILGVKVGKPTFHSQYDNATYQYPIQGVKWRVMPTQKNTKLIQALIEKHSNPGEMVLDTFAGSGTTAVAAHLSGRRFQGCELNKEIWEKSITRIEGEIEWLERKTELSEKRARKRQASETASSPKRDTQDPTEETSVIKNPIEDKENDITILHVEGRRGCTS